MLILTLILIARTSKDYSRMYPFSGWRVYRFGRFLAGLLICPATVATLLFTAQPLLAHSSVAASPPITVATNATGSFTTYLPSIVNAGHSLPLLTPTLITRRAIWKYLDDGSNQGTAWYQSGFDDTAWPAGLAELGYGEGDEATAIRFGPDANAKYMTSYFRHEFSVAAPDAYKTLDLWLLRDDGAVIYLNGQEVARSNLPAGQIAYDTPAGVGAIEQTSYLFTLSPTVLVTGRNMLAVEIHQNSPSSSDLSFDLSLSATLTDTTRFAVIGDYGNDGDAEADVAKEVKAWRPDFVITVGDNNYPVGSAETIIANIDKHYGEFIQHDNFAATRFYPSLGNHDWMTADAHPYLDHFTLPAIPGEERYYDFTRGNVHFFALDSDDNEPDGNTADSLQAAWLQCAMIASTAQWKVVYFHHPPYSSGHHGSQQFMQWPLQAWNASVVLAGHDHNYERLAVAGLPYFVNGSGGQMLRPCLELLPESKLCYDDDYGAMLVEADDSHMTFTFVARDGAVIDTCTLPGTCQ